jgi:3'-5' exoribonuclease
MINRRRPGIPDTGQKEDNMLNINGTNMSGICMLTGLEERRTREQKPYLVLSLRDQVKADGTADTYAAKFWNASKEVFMIKEGDLVDVHITVGEYKGEKDYTVMNITKSAEGNSTDFVPHSLYKAEDMYHYLLEFSKKNCGEYHKVVEAVFTDPDIKERLLINPASLKVHQPVKAGLLEHTMGVLGNAVGFMNNTVMMTRLLTKESGLLHPDLLYAGCILHDVGKAYELSIDPLGIIEYTDECQLTGHAVAGRDMVLRIGKDLIDDEKLNALCHIILSHHYKPEWGAAFAPKLAEAVIVFLADKADAMISQISSVLPGLEMRETSKAMVTMDNIHLYRLPF